MRTYHCVRKNQRRPKSGQRYINTYTLLFYTNQPKNAMEQCYNLKLYYCGNVVIFYV